MKNKRVISLLMALVLCLSLLPFGAFAEEAETVEPEAEIIVEEETGEESTESAESTEETAETEELSESEETAEPEAVSVEEETEESSEIAEETAEDGDIVDSGSCGADATWTLDSEGTLTISGTGAIDELYFSSLDIKKLVIQEGITSIAESRFFGSGLTSISLPNSVTSIGDHAFKYCSGLTSVTIPAGVTSIGEDAFANCEKLTSIVVSSSNEKYSSRYGVLYNKSKTKVIFCPAGKSGSVTIPSGVTSVGEYAFADCINLTKVTISSSVASIGDCAFRNCSGLTKVTIYSGVTSIGEHAFDGCSSLTSISVPNSVTKLGDHAFYNCTNLTSATLGSKVTSVGWGMFEGCSSLTKITIPDSVKSIGENAFCDCSGLTSVTIGSGVTSIGDYAFANCSSLTGVTIGKKVTSIGKQAFYWCDSLTKITIPSNVTAIGDFAFGSCFSLTGVTIGSGVASIGEGAFQGCEQLVSIAVNSSNEKYSSRYGVLYNKSKTELICYPAGKSGSVTLSSSVTSLGKYAFNHCCQLTSISVSSSNKKFSSQDGILYNKSKTTLICCPAGKSGSVIIPSGVTSIAEDAFMYCYNITGVTIPSGVTGIGESAFWNCYSITSVTIPKSVTGIGADAFWACYGLKNVYYTGSKTAWNSIDIGRSNEDLTSASMHYYSYAVKYNANGGTGGPTIGHKTAGKSYTISKYKPTRTGYTFLGWATSSKATTAKYKAGKTYSSLDSLTLYAVWKAN